MIVLADARSALRLAWCAETSADPDLWTPLNPAVGQCAVTALVVQDILGGELVRGVVVGDVSHYWNEVDGTDIDLTVEQFCGAPVWGHDIGDRSYVLSFPATVARYRLLWERLLTLILRDEAAQ